MYERKEKVRCSISKFLELPSESSLNPVSRFLLNRINWEAGELSESENIQLKLEVLRIVLIRYCESVTDSVERKLAAYFNDNTSKSVMCMSLLLGNIGTFLLPFPGINLEKSSWHFLLFMS